LPELRITFPTVEGYHKDELALNVLAQIIAGSKNSPLYKQIVEVEKLAPNASAFHNAMELAGEFVIRVRAKPGADLDAVKGAIETALKQFENDGVDPKDLRRIKAEQQTSLYIGFATVLGKTNQMAIDNEFAGDPAHAIKSAQMLNEVTADDVMAAYRKYVKRKASIMTSFVPKGQAELSVKGAKLASVWIEEVTEGNANEEVSQGAEAEYEKTPSKYDRSEPPFGDLPLFKMPTVWEQSIGDHAVVLGIESSEIPVVTFDVTIDGGGWLDPLEKKGTASLLARLMNEGTATKTAAEFEQAFGLLGSGINISAGAEELTISVTTLASAFEDSVALVQEVLTSPRWQDADFERVKSAALTSIKGREASPNSIAALSFNKLLYGDGHPLGIPQAGTRATVDRINMDDLKAFHTKLLGSPVRMHVTGSMEKDRAVGALRGIADVFNVSDAARPAYDIPAQNNAGKVFFIDVPDSKQSVIIIGKLTLASTDENANKLDFTNEKLGGGISGDLAQVLRIEKGYTYGAVSVMLNGKEVQPFRAQTRVRANATQPSLEIMKDMIGQYGEKFAQADVEMTQLKLVKENARAFEALNAKRGLLRAISKYGKSKTFVEDDQKELMAMKVADFKRIAGRYMREPEMTYVIVGDKATQLGPVTEFADGTVTELDIYGNVVR
jgi:zinc protease